MALGVQGDCGKLDLLGGQLGAVCCFAQHLERQLLGLLEVYVFLVLLLQDGLCARVVCADAGGLPAGVVSRGVAGVELEPVPGVVAGKQEGDAEWSQPTELGVSLFQVAHLFDDVFQQRFSVVYLQVLLRGLPHVIDQDACVGSHTGHCAEGVVVQPVHFFCTGVLFQQLAGDFSFCDQHNSILAHDADCRACVVDCLQRVLHLVQSTFWRKYGSSTVVSSGHPSMYIDLSDSYAIPIRPILSVRSACVFKAFFVVVSMIRSISMK